MLAGLKVPQAMPFTRIHLQKKVAMLMKDAKEVIGSYAYTIR